jgi:hypothetical protein
MNAKLKKKKNKKLRDFPLFHHGGTLATGGLIQPKALRAQLRSKSRGSSSQFNADDVGANVFKFGLNEGGV